MPQDVEQAPGAGSASRLDDAGIRVLPDNAAVVLRGRDDRGERAEALLGALAALGRRDVLIIDLDDDRDWFDVVTEEQMREHGWVHVDPSTLDLGIVHDRTL